ncbi:hypothetical protein WA026_005996 [Henosepilachna vigintioctopunctata]|uniref:Uncharacterized protein n=1 Tax=Henosepilachna vigintioctopunctata TaxID=420089 RepID=A0AAW1U784_9CUCU
MPEELTESGGSSQGRINPRLRSTRRVRPVPYESCGGLCSFLNSGCFTMCCGYPKTVRRSSSVYYKKKKNKRRKEVIAESSKKVVKPNVDDGITDADRTVFSEFDESNLPGGFLYISQADIELEEGKTKKTQDGVGVINTSTSCEKIDQQKEPTVEEII